MHEGLASPTAGVDYMPTGDGSCLDQVIAQDCYDLGPLARYQMTLEANPTASHHAVWAGEEKVSNIYIATSDCSVQIVSYCKPPEDSDECEPASASACFNAVAYNEAGQSTEPVEMCIGEPSASAEPEGGDVGADDVAGDLGAVSADEGKGEAGSGCGVSAAPSASAGWLLLAILAVLALLGWRRAGRSEARVALEGGGR